MIVLGIDTATVATVVGLRGIDGVVLQARDDPRPGERPGHSTRLLGLAAELLDRAGLRWNDLQRIAVGVGPGTFTGLRVGLASAHGLALSSSAELVGVSSLRALSLNAREQPRVLAAVDARRGELFVAGYQQGMESIAPRAVAPDALGELLAGADWLALGDGARLYRDELEDAGASVPRDSSELHLIGGSSLCELGLGAEIADEPLVPDYLRHPDATLALQGAGR
ncbi:MAG TPA: tRNA (adenosine(37)-N6)-threonylcarbamoyltransferase complex dimerization subunit type 1 TsaB [Solirubrobacteraceae bacterium]|nr:tRNA (adenosine(37)-N6)-threonylcarbamoyltransferase complex dimerization subunit type 1 TsaB [Solirubrobacteraceae bacterium]